MLAKIRDFFNQNLALAGEAGQMLPERERQLAAAALLIEVCKADFELEDAEQETVIKTLQQTFDLDSIAVDELVKLAEQEAHNSASLYQFTRLVNDFYSYEQKLELIDSMWQVAYADGNLDKYEEHLIRKVAELVHVQHKDYIRIKLAKANKLE